MKIVGVESSVAGGGNGGEADLGGGGVAETEVYNTVFYSFA